jgi:hypothetical protein
MNQFKMVEQMLLWWLYGSRQTYTCNACMGDYNYKYVTEVFFGMLKVSYVV